jgi:ribosomal-protein-alanine N-acetyltransferase
VKEKVVEFVHVTFREMDEDEVEDIIDLEYEVLGSSIFVKLSTLPYRKKVIVADAGVIAGCAVVYWDEESFHLGSIVVRKEYRNKGIGEELIKRCIEMAQKMGYKRVWLEVSVNNKEAVEMYKKVGFRVYETLKHFYGIGKHAYKMSYTLGET